jgi:hypothetical protein
MECQKCGGYWVSPENLDMVIGERDAALESLLEIYNAMVRYEGDVDGDAPVEHRRMMDRIRGILFSENENSAGTAAHERKTI